MMHRQAVIIGGGPAGLAAALRRREKGVSDILILSALACVLYLAVRSVIRRKRSGCDCGCEGCPHPCNKKH